MITIDFEKRGKRTLTDFIYQSIKNQILQGNLSENDKLPSKRSLALHLGVSVITIQNAYLQLIDEGYLFSIEKKGFYVSDIAKRLGNSPQSEQTKTSPEKSPPPQFFADFSSNATAPEKFPFSLWSRTMRQVLNSSNEGLLKRTDVFGSLELRRAICLHLKAFRNMELSEDQIIIGAGTESLYSMLVQFLGRNKIFAVENPGYHKAADIFKLNGTKCKPVKIDREGIKVSSLEKSKADIVHVSPSHHFPTGIIMNFKRRTELLEWAYSKKGRYIIEDDYDSEFRFNGKPLPTLQSIDNAGRVIYINTFSKTLSPSFRISYMVLPPSLAQAFSQKLGFYSCQVSSFEQFTLASFIQDGNYEKHINKMKNYYRSLRNNLITALNNSPLSKSCTIHEEHSGLHFLLTLNQNLDALQIKEKLKAADINLRLLSDYYYIPARASEESKRTFIINYSAIRRDRIPEIVKRMTAALEKK